MPNLSFPKSALEPRPNLPAGTIQVIFKGFKPKLSKKKEGKDQSVNFNPELVIVNDQRTTEDGKQLNGQRIFDALNESFLPRIQDFFHALGVPLTENGDNVDLPGSFDNNTNDPDPSTWGEFRSPAVNEIATLELATVKSRRPGAKPTDTQTDVKRYICRVPGCTVQHSESLLQNS